MITLDEVMPLLLEACPAFRPVWDAYYRYAYLESGESERLYYPDIGQFADWLYERFESGETECFPAVFAVIERLFAEGNDQVQDLAALGFVEGLQNVAGYARGPSGHAVFLSWLGPLTRKEWENLAE